MRRSLPISVSTALGSVRTLVSLHVDFRGEALTMGIIIAAITGALSYALTAVVRSFALGNDVLDKPNERSSPDAPTRAGPASRSSYRPSWGWQSALRWGRQRSRRVHLGRRDADYRDDRMDVRLRRQIDAVTHQERFIDGTGRVYAGANEVRQDVDEYHTATVLDCAERKWQSGIDDPH